MASNNAPDKVGHVTEKWWETKKIVDWKFESALAHDSPLLEKLGPPVATVNIKNGHGPKDEVFFVARSEWFGKRNELVDRDLVKLKAKVEQEFRDMVIAHTDVKWEDWLEVKIRGVDEDDEVEGFRVRSKTVDIRERKGSAMIHVEYEILKRARFPDGRDMVMDGNTLYPFPKAKPAGKDNDYSNREYSQEDDSQYAYIPATPENIEAVQELMRRLGEVNDRLQHLLSQKTIKGTIMAIAGGQLLLEKK